MARLLWGIFGFSSLFFNFLQGKVLRVEAEVIYEQDQGLRFSMKRPPATPAILPQIPIARVTNQNTTQIDFHEK